jgi:hypothetical protein
VLFIHEVHEVAGQAGAAFEELLRARWAPALARDDEARLAWCARSMPGAVSFPELITLTALPDGAALERFGTRMRRGDLRDAAAELDTHRVRVTRRIVSQLDFSPLEIDLGALPPHPEPYRAQGELYVHDFVPPRLGMQREYEAKMGEVFVFLRDLKELGTPIWAGFETVAGGGTVPESLMYTHVANAEAAVRMLTLELPREAVVPGMWMYDGLKLRDTWTSRLLRSVTWSPIG